MRLTWIAGIWLVAVFVISAATATSALAEPPEFQVPNKKTGVLEPLKKPVKFTESGGALLWIGGPISKQTPKLGCASSAAKGKLTGPKTMTVQTTYKGCEDPETKVTCQSKKKAGEIKTSKVEGTLVLASSGAVEPPVVAVSMPAIGSYKCGTTSVSEKGLVLGALTPVETLTETLEVTYAEGEEEPELGCGKQALQLIEGMGPCQHLTVQIGSGPQEPEWIAADKKPAEKKKEFVGHVSILK